MTLRDSKTQRLLLTVVVVGVALWGYFIADFLPFGYRRQVKKVQELRAAQETVSGELEKARRTVNNLPQLEAEQQELERKWKQAETLLPSDKEMPQLLTQITQAGDQAGVTFELFKPSASRPQEFYNENPVDVQVKGGFHQVGVFLARLANLPRIVNVTGLDLEGAQQKGRKGAPRDRTAGGDDGRTDQTLVASFTATAYSLRDPSAPAEQAPPAEKVGRRGLHTGAASTQAGTAVSAGDAGRSTPGGITKRLADKAKNTNQVGEGAQ
jgi:type IV pilus assembly protein PilO